MPRYSQVQSTPFTEVLPARQVSQLEAPSSPTRRTSDGRDSSKTEHRNKVIQDRIYDQVRLQPALVAVLDTPQFQRLRDLHQVGNSRYLFPGACHSRFEHSIGVAHLGMEYLRRLSANHQEVGPELRISKNDMVCIGLAGLCHDLGHGPMSHMFEDFVNRIRKQKRITARWCHEDASVQMFRFLLTENNIEMSMFGLTRQDLVFVEHLIKGLKPSADWPGESVVGRGPEKRFLFDIICNKRNGIDVDKLDYFLRDSMCCYGKLPDIHIERMFQCSRVMECEGQNQICFEEKVALSLGELFNLRAKLHKFVYQHRVVKCLDEMTTRALLLAEGNYFILLENGKKLTLSECVEDMEAYSKLGDWIFSAIQFSTEPELKPARDVLKKIRNREMFELVGVYVFNPPKAQDEPGKPPLTPLRQERCSTPPRQVHDVAESDEDGHEDPIDHAVTIEEMTDQVSEGAFTKEDVFIACSHIFYGSSGDSKTKRSRDPINNVRFFNPKKDPNQAHTLDENRVSALFTPLKFEEHTAFVYSCSPTHTEKVHHAFQQWYSRALSKGKVIHTTPFVNASPGLSAKKRKRLRESEALSLPGVTQSQSQE